MGFVSTTIYDALGRVEATEDALGRRSTSLYDQVGQLAASVDARAVRTTLQHDLRGSLLSRTNGRGYRTSYAYDALARQEAEEDALGRRTTWSFDPAGRLLVKLDARPWAVTYAHDPAGRQTESLYRDGERITLSYDAAGHVLQISQKEGIWTRTYDPVGRLRTEAAPSHANQQPLTHHYDPTGNRTVLETWFGQVTNSFDGRGSLTGLVDPEAGATAWLFEPLAQAVRQENPDGTVSTTSYDANGRLTGTLHKTAGGVALDQALLAYDAVGNPLLKVTLDGWHTMTYDGIDQLLSEDHPLAGVKTWTYDPAQNRLSQDHTQAGVRTLTQWAYDGADQLVTETVGAAVTNFTFDAAGNQQLVVEAGGGRTTYTWNTDNRLLLIELPSGERNTMSYRADGLRHRLVDTEGDKRMVWDSQGPTGYVDLVEEATE